MDLEEFRTKRTDIISEMLDNPDDRGIYPTGKCYRKLDELFVQMAVRAEYWENIGRQEESRNRKLGRVAHAAEAFRAQQEAGADCNMYGSKEFQDLEDALDARDKKEPDHVTTTGQKTE